MPQKENFSELWRDVVERNICEHLTHAKQPRYEIHNFGISPRMEKKFV